MKSWKTTVCAVLFMAMASCGKGKQEGGSGGGGGEPLDKDTAKFLLDSVQKDITGVKDALAKGEDPKYKCAAAGSYAEDLAKAKDKSAEPAIKELAKLCGYDVPLAALEGATKKAEEARKAKPDENPLSECYSADHDMAIKDLEKGGFAGDDKVKAVTARWAAACPAK